METSASSPLSRMAATWRAITSWRMPLSTFGSERVATDFRHVGGNPHAGAAGQIDRAIDEAHRLGDQIVLVIDAGQPARLHLGGRRDRDDAGQHCGGRGGGELEISEIPNPGLDRAVDVAD